MKEYWIVSSNSNKFRLDDLLRNNNVVDWKQGQYKFKTGDIVYIYSTLPKGRITYEMEVVKDNIPFDEVINQEEYWLDRKEFQKGIVQNNYCRFKRLTTVDCEALNLHNLLRNGLKQAPQGAMKPSKELLSYIKSCLISQLIYSKNITQYIKAYINNWDYINNLELYKWDAFKHFNEYFYNGNDIFVKIKEGLAKTDNLLISLKYLPYDMLKTFASEKPKEVEILLNNLFDESISLKDRIIDFRKGCNELQKEMALEGYSNWKGRNNVSTYQDARAMSVYLALRYPNKYYLYKYSVFYEFAKIIGYEIHNKNWAQRFIEYLELCDEIKQELLKESTFISFYDSWLRMKEYKDEEYNLLVQDFVYAVAVHLNSSNLNKANKNKPLDKTCSQIEVGKYQSFISQKIKTFKGIKNVDYAKNDALCRGLGLNGECWAMIYEKDRLQKLGIQFEVQHSSIEKGDGLGYDILSVEEDGVTPRYIEVKTTTGSLSQAFYYSDNELSFSKMNDKNYYIYRIYNFKGATMQADLLILHGSLADLKGTPITYKASIKTIDE